MASEERSAHRLGQLWENIKDIANRGREERPVQQEKTMVESTRPAPVLRPRGMGAHSVNRQAYYKKLAHEHRRENKKTRHLRTRDEQRPTRKFDKEQKNQIRSNFNRGSNANDHEREP